MNSFKFITVYRPGAKRPRSTQEAREYQLNAVAPLPFRKRCASRRPTLSQLLVLLVFFQVACSSNDNAHTTVTTVVAPPSRQVLTAVPMPSPGNENAGSPSPATSPSTTEQDVGVDLSKPLLVSNLANGKTFRPGEVVPIDFSVRNAKLRAEGGEYRIRYIIDDEDPQWADSPQPFGLSGWVPGKHTIRLELIGPDGWPYRNGNQNVVTREITVVG